MRNVRAPRGPNRKGQNLGAIIGLLAGGLEGFMGQRNASARLQQEADLKREELKQRADEARQRLDQARQVHEDAVAALEETHASKRADRNVRWQETKRKEAHDAEQERQAQGSRDSASVAHLARAGRDMAETGRAKTGTLNDFKLGAQGVLNEFKGRESEIPAEIARIQAEMNDPQNRLSDQTVNNNRIKNLLRAQTISQDPAMRAQFEGQGQGPAQAPGSSGPMDAVQQILRRLQGGGQQESAGPSMGQAIQGYGNLLQSGGGALRGLLGGQQQAPQQPSQAALPPAQSTGQDIAPEQSVTPSQRDQQTRTGVLGAYHTAFNPNMPEEQRLMAWGWLKRMFPNAIPNSAIEMMQGEGR